MADSSTIKVTIAFNDPDLDTEELDDEARRLLSELRDIDEVEEVNRTFDPNPPQGNKALGGFLVGMLTAEVNPANAKKLMGFLSDRLSGKAIEMEVEANGKKLKVKVGSQAELDAALEAAQKFIAG